MFVTFVSRKKWLLAAIIAAGIMPASTKAAETLRWKFKAGDAADYVMTRNLDGKFDFNGQEMDFNFGLVIDLSWDVKSVADDGTAEVHQKIVRVQLDTASPIGGQLKYDSTQGEPTANPAWGMFGPMVKALVGAEISMKVSPNGEVKDITLPESLVKALSPPGGGRRRMNFGGMSEDGIKEIVQRSFTRLPDAPVEGEENWEQQFASTFGNAGKQVTDVKFSLAGVEDKEGKKVAKIVATTEMSFEPNADQTTEFELEITEQEGNWTALFDVEKGRTLESTSKQKTTMEIIAGDREFKQQIDETIAIKEGKSPEAKPEEKKPEEKAEEKEKKESSN
ncbi:MAG: DUF6263 family protein [Planctomycetota bacterium]